MHADIAADRPDTATHGSTTHRTSERGFSVVDILMVVGLIGVVAGIAVPVTGGAYASQRFRNDAQSVTSLVGLAKMRASAGLTRARVRANVVDNTFTLERWDKTTSTWVAEQETAPLSTGVRFGFGAVATPPPNTQATIDFSPPCRVGVTAASATIGNTACIVFNSRGLPVDGAGDPFGGHALYLTDGASVAAATVTATPRIRRWSTAISSIQWKEQQ